MHPLAIVMPGGAKVHASELGKHIMDGDAGLIAAAAVHPVCPWCETEFEAPQGRLAAAVLQLEAPRRLPLRWSSLRRARRSLRTVDGRRSAEGPCGSYDRAEQLTFLAQRDVSHALITATIHQFPEFRIALVCGFGSDVFGVDKMLTDDKAIQQPALHKKGRAGQRPSVDQPNQDIRMDHPPTAPRSAEAVDTSLF
jgi:hypothetical protein